MGPPQNKRKRARVEEDDAVPASIEDRDLAAPAAAKRARLKEKRSLFVHSLPADATSESLTDFFSQHFPVKHAVIVVDKETQESKGYGFVTLADADDVIEAKKALDKKEWDGKRIRIDVAEPRHRNEPEKKSKPASGHTKKDDFQPLPKLIVRNLPWSIKTSEQLSRLFTSFGRVKYSDLPQTKGKLKGFGFVTIRGKPNAEKALGAINGKVVDGRTLAVDWAVDKESWDRDQQQNADSDDDVDVEEADEQPTREVKKAGADDALNADVESFMKTHMQNLEDEDESEEDDDEEDNNIRPPPYQEPKKLMTDNSSTVFVRNLPFTTTDEQLKLFFGHFGKVRYARTVVDRTTDKPAGTGFVCFITWTDAKQCIKAAPRPMQPTAAAKHSILQDESADPDGRYTLDGRLLQVSQAVNKQEASNLADSSLAKRREKDKRRLFLLSEGAIGGGSPLLDLLTPAEVQMRTASANQRKKLVQKNPSLHISLTRLALRNIPRDTGSKELKDLARKAIVGFATDVKEGRRQPLSKEENARDTKEAKEKEQERRAKGKGIVRQAKVVFENTEGSKVAEKTGAGKSRGYGFIEYTTHHWALMGLRYLNGYQLQGDNGRKQRLVVEFAIENAQVVQRRRTTESQSGQPAQAKAKDSTKPNGKGSKVPDAEHRVKGKKGRKQPTKEEGKANGEANAPGAPETTMQQKLQVRKRVMRKKKANARGQK